MPDQDQLSMVVAAFDQWRQSRSSRNARIPQSLREQAAALRTHYSYQAITSALKLSGSQLKQWVQSAQPSDEPAEFIRLPVTIEPPTDECNVELSFANGGQMRLSGRVSPALITTLIQEMKS